MKKLIKKSVLLLAISSAINISQAQESSAVFLGLEAGFGVESQSNKVNYQGFLSGKQSSTRDTAAFLSARYGWAIGGPLVLTLGARYDLNDSDYGSVTYVSSSTQTVSAKLRTGLSVSLEPGYIIHPDWMLYAKLMLNHANGEFTDTGAGSGSTRHSGHGLGLGVAARVSEHWLGRFEVSQVNYSREPGNLSTGKPQSIRAGLSLGYRF